MPTPRQITLIENLRGERVMDQAPGALTTLLEGSIEDLDYQQTRLVIDTLFTLPKRPRDAAPAGEDRYAHLRDIPKSYYALWAEQVHLAGLTDLMRPDQELLFLRVKPWKNAVFMDRLHGSWGGFTRTRLTLEQQVALAAVIRLGPSEAGKRFADHYKRCARCGAELTEDDSRARGYGPTCWGHMGH